MGLNLISSIVVFATQLSISFFLTPFILKNLGNEAFGFLTLANSIVSYGYILTVAINSVAGRFVALEYHKNNIKRANFYFSSVVIVNLFFTLLIAFFSLIFTINLEYFLNITDELTIDVKVMFLLYFLNFCLGLFNTIFTITAFVKNKLYLLSIRNLISSLIFGLGIVVVFYCLAPRLYYVPVCTLFSTIFIFFSTFYMSKLIAPDIVFNKSQFSLKMIKNLLNSGIWNSFNALNRVLLTSVDLLICNIFLNPASMGILAISKSIILIIESFCATISSIFNPILVEFYAKKDIKNIVKNLKFYIKIVGFIITTPCVIFVVFGYDFFSLWLWFKTSFEIKEIYILSMISLVPIIFISYTFVLYNLDSVTNQLKRPAFANFILGISVVLGQILVLKFSDFGLLGIVVLGAILYLCRIVFFDIINAAVNLNLSIFTFYPAIFKNIFVFCILLLVFIFAKEFISLNSWFDFIFYSFILLVFGYFVNFTLLFSKSEKDIIFSKIISKFKKDLNG